MYMLAVDIIHLTADHWEVVREIYEAGIASRNATFEKKSPDWETWDRSHRQDCRLLAISQGRVAGWAALSNVSERCVYAGVAEVSIYMDPSFSGKGIGSLLMKRLIEESEKKGIWTLQAGIFPENSASIRLHEKNGFRVIGMREKIGKLDGIWRNTVLLERRSRIAGMD
jgi:L-amino acid N-acyltransferase YncA